MKILLFLLDFVRKMVFEVCKIIATIIVFINN